jgi:hypothetical protein
MPTRRKSAEAIRSQQTRFLAFFGAVVALVLLGFAAGDTKLALYGTRLLFCPLAA